MDPDREDRTGPGRVVVVLVDRREEVGGGGGFWLAGRWGPGVEVELVLEDGVERGEGRGTWREGTGPDLDRGGGGEDGGLREGGAEDGVGVLEAVEGSLEILEGKGAGEAEGEDGDAGAAGDRLVPAVLRAG